MSTCNPSISRMETKSLAVPPASPAETLSFQFSEMLLNAHLGARIRTWVHASTLGCTHPHSCACTRQTTTHTHTHTEILTATLFIIR